MISGVTFTCASTEGHTLLPNLILFAIIIITTIIKFCWIPLVLTNWFLMTKTRWHNAWHILRTTIMLNSATLPQEQLTWCCCGKQENLFGCWITTTKLSSTKIFYREKVPCCWQCGHCSWWNINKKKKKLHFDINLDHWCESPEWQLLHHRATRNLYSL